MTVGKTKDTGFQFGIRKTFALPLEEVWVFLCSPKGTSIWLGEIDGELEIQQPFVTAEGTTGTIRLFQSYAHLRMSWKKADWQNTATLQLRVIGNHHKTTIAFHLEKLLNEQQREAMKKHWSDVMQALTVALA